MSGTKHDAGKIEVGLIPWTAPLVAALRGTALPAEADPEMAELISTGQFLPALVQLFKNKRVSIPAIISVLRLGAERYGYFNWKGLEPLRIYNAAMRHALRIGEPDEGACHDDHIACCLLFLISMNWQPKEST